MTKEMMGATLRRWIGAGALGLAGWGIWGGCGSAVVAAPRMSPPPVAVAAVVSSEKPTPVGSMAPVSPDLTRQTGAMPSLAPLIKQLRPSVVNIYTTQNVRPRRGMRPNAPPSDMDEFFERFFGGEVPEQQKQQALGSGFLIGDGLALTNNHVIEGADEIRVRLSDTREFAAKVVGRDPSTDVALLQLQGDGANGLPSARLGDSDGVEVGDYVVAIGNPFGLNMTVTSGIVSAKERVIGAGPYDDFIQTDASINPGNSGGPLFNLAGDVIGINTAIVARGQGIGFAVPVNLVKDLLPQLRSSGHVSRGWLGVGIQAMTPELATNFGLDKPAGVLLSQVFPGGPAEKAGLRSGDVVLEFNGHPIDNPGGLSRSVAAVAPNKNASMKIWREGKEKTIEVTVAERDESGLAQGRVPAEGRASGGQLVGVDVAPIPPRLAERLGVAPGEGLLIEQVRDGSAAALAGIQEGDVLMELQRRPVPTIDAFNRVLQTVHAGDRVLFRVRRGGSVLYLAAKAPKG